MQTVLDCPIIRNMERTGTPDGKPEPEYRCPICKGFRKMEYKQKKKPPSEYQSQGGRS